MTGQGSCILPVNGTEQRFVFTGVAARKNEIKQHRNFSRKHFPGVAACGFYLTGKFHVKGKDRNTVRE